jgi:ABC-type branched-subunit amino acid transport system ATPase component/ABC-type branched-subunit amino acid transport system permease subunit
VFLSYTVVTGLGGIVSLAQAAFVTGSGLMTGLLMDRVGAPWLVALLGAVSFSVLLGVVVAVPALRLGGLSLALSSLALGFIGDQVLFVWPTLENGQSGWIVKVPFGLSDPKRMAIVLVVVIGLVVLGLRSLRKSQTGRAIVAIRTSEAAAESSGLSLPATKLWLFGLSAGIAGLGGFLIASTQGSANDSTYTTTIGLVWIASVVLWGVRRSGAAIIAAMTAMILPGLLISGIHWWPWVPSWLSWRGTKNPWVPEILFGLGAIQMARSPDGLLAVLGVAGRAKPALEEIPASGPISAEPMQSAPRAVFLDPSVEQRDAAVVIELVNVSAGYEEVKVLRGVDLVLRRGTITALVGANGAGKSTLAKVIAGSVLPSEGAIWYSGKELHGRSTFLRARDGILLSPEGRGIFPGLSVDENLAIRLRQSSERSRVYDRFPILGERRQIAAGALSGGEQQLLALASIVAKPPTVVIADEPTLGLAPLVVTEILRVIQELRDEGVAILLIEEKARSVLDLADDVAFLERGQIIWQGPQGQVDEQQMTSIFLGRAGGELLGELREVPR